MDTKTTKKETTFEITERVGSREVASGGIRGPSNNGKGDPRDSRIQTGSDLDT